MPAALSAGTISASAGRLRTRMALVPSAWRTRSTIVRLHLRGRRSRCQVPLRRRAAHRASARRANRERRRRLVGLARQDVREGGVEPVDQAGLRAEVGAQRERLERDAADALLPRLEEERDLRFAEAVDRLHRVADQEQRAAVVGLPAGGQSLEQFELRVRGVLELVDQDVLDARVEREQEVGRLLGRAERAHRGLRHLGEVGLAVLGEHHLQVRGGERQELEDRAERLPLLVGVAFLGGMRSSASSAWRSGSVCCSRCGIGLPRLRQVKFLREQLRRRTRSMPSGAARGRVRAGVSRSAKQGGLQLGAGRRRPVLRSHWSRFASMPASIDDGVRTLLSRCTSRRLGGGRELVEYAERGLPVVVARVFDHAGLRAEAATAPASGA